MITQIGITAGNIWELLDHENEVDMSSLFSHLKDSPELILMSLGWLVREGYVALNIKQDRYRVTLRNR